MRLSQKLFTSLACVLLPLAPLRGQEAKWTPACMMKLKTIREVQLSPDKKTVLAVVSEASSEQGKDSYLSRLYKIEADETKQAVALTSAHYSAMQPRWSPTGEWIAFLSDLTGRTKNIYLLRASDAPAAPLALTQLNHDIETFRWSPDGRYLAFVSPDKKRQSGGVTNKSASIIYEEEKVVNRLWLVDLYSGQAYPKAMTGDDYHVRGCGDFGTVNEEFDWSPDGRFITFAYSPSCCMDAFYVESHLATLDLQTGAIAPLEKRDKHESLPRYSPDGKWISYLAGGSSYAYAFNRRIAIRSTEREEEYLLPETINGGPFLAGPSLLGWSADSRCVYFFEPIGTKFHLACLPIDGREAQSLMPAGLMIKEPALSMDGSSLAFIGQAADLPPEAYIAELPSFHSKRLTHFNKEFLACPPIKTEIIDWQASDKQRIEGLLTYPCRYQKGRRYPLLLVIHGGPMAFFDETYIGTPYPYPLASFAEAGFLILRANPRGSCGYGKAFRCLNYGDWGGKDFGDLLAGIDALIEKGLADPQKLGVMGWSYGGYLTAWAITQTNRFKAASMGAGLSNLASMSGTTDLHKFLSDYLGNFWENPELYQQRSPVYHVKNVHTPCLIQHGLADKRVPVSQAFEYYHALKSQGKPVSLILYPRMGHRFSEPSQQLDLMERNLDWFSDRLLNANEEVF